MVINYSCTDCLLFFVLMLYKYRNGLLPMQYVFLICSRAGCKKYVTLLRLVTYFLQAALERMKNPYCMGKGPFLYLYNIRTKNSKQSVQEYFMTIQSLTLSHIYNHADVTANYICALKHSCRRLTKR